MDEAEFGVDDMNEEDYNILKSLRAHGWDREINKKLSILAMEINLGRSVGIKK